MKKYLIILLLLQAVTLFSQNKDIELLRKFNVNRNEQLDKTFKFITNTAAPITIATPAIIYGIGLIQKDSVTKRKALYIGASVITAAAITTILKYAVDRTRPFVTYTDIQKLTSAGSYSFPSGHTSDAFTFATSVSLAYPKWYVAAPAFVWAGAVGYSRMHLGVHYPSDVFAGACIGAGSAYLCHVLNKRILQPKHARVSE